LAGEGRETILNLLEKAGIRVIITPAGDTNNGAIESLAEAHLCADLFKQHRDEIDGVLVTLPNFGDERAIANTLRFANLDVPVLIHAFPDVVETMDIKHRRDSFCGKMSACNNLRQYGIKYSLTTNHTMDPNSPAFMADLMWFVGVCRVVRGMKTARLGMMGARPKEFKTVRFSEKLLDQAGISVETLDLSEVYGQIERLQDSAAEVQAKLVAIKNYARTANVPDQSLMRMAKFGVVLDSWIDSNELDATAIQCWTSMEEYFGVVPCTLMSMSSNKLNPAACETDIVGALAMLALQLASGKPSALVDWNNNYGEDPDKGVVFHCSNLPKDVFIDDIPVMDYQEIIAGTVGKENTWGTMPGRWARRTPGGRSTGRSARVRSPTCGFQRTTSPGRSWRTRAKVTSPATRLTPGVVKVPRYQELLAHICDNGFEHHVTINQAHTARVINEAFNYLGWSTYWHK